MSGVGCGGRADISVLVVRVCATQVYDGVGVPSPGRRDGEGCGVATNVDCATPAVQCRTEVVRVITRNSNFQSEKAT